MVKNKLLPIVVLFACLLLVPLLWGAVQTRAQNTPLVWTQINLGLGPAVTLTGVYMVDGPDGAWMVSSESPRGAVFRIARQDAAWRIVSRTEVRSPLRAVVAINDNNVWAVGEEGLIVHKDATGWHELPNPVSGATLTALQMFGNGEEGWAGGFLPAEYTYDYTDRAVLLHYHGGTWEQDRAVSDPHTQIRGLHFLPGRGWAVGQILNYPDGPTAPAVWRYENQTWKQESLPLCPPGFGCDTALQAVRVLADGDVWAVGYQRYGMMGFEPLTPLSFHRQAGTWHQVLPAQTPVGDTAAGSRQGAGLFALAFTADGFGLAVGQQTFGFPGPVPPYILSYQADGRWHYEQVPYIPLGNLTGVSLADKDHALAVGVAGLILGYGYGGTPPAPWPTITPPPFPYPSVPPGTPTPTPAPGPPTQRVPDPHLPNVLYFPVVGHSLQGGFRAYWEAHGGLAQFGYPLTEEFWTTAPGSPGPNFTTQYFERARFEWHPENRPPYDILLGLLGNELTVNRRGEAAFGPHPAQAGAGGIYFPETQHNLAPQFVAYWQSHGGLPVYGYPISEAFTEVSATDGKLYLVQYFERNRFEYHPELPEAYRVSLGLLGVDQLRGLGWVP